MMSLPILSQLAHNPFSKSEYQISTNDIGVNFDFARFEPKSGEIDLLKPIKKQFD